MEFIPILDSQFFQCTFHNNNRITNKNLVKSVFEMNCTCRMFLNWFKCSWSYNIYTLVVVFLFYISWQVTSLWLWWIFYLFIFIYYLCATQLNLCLCKYVLSFSLPTYPITIGKRYLWHILFSVCIILFLVLVMTGTY